MIIYIFNNYFPDNSGFAKRCKMEIDALSQTEDITILCRKRRVKELPFYKSPYKKIPIKRFDNNNKLMERPNKYKHVFYELSRNISLVVSIAIILNQILFSIKKNIKTNNNIRIYAVSSPLTVPLTAWLIGKMHRISLEVLEFHDLEPELAKHIKKLNDKSLVMRIEYFLEKFLCNAYNKIIVTTTSQAERIIKRTKIASNKICVIPNVTVNSHLSKSKNRDIRKEYGIERNDFLIGYVSTFYYDYTVLGMTKVLYRLPQLLPVIPSLKIILVGDGDGLSQLRQIVSKLGIDKNVIFTGKIKNVSEVLNAIDICLIPWEKDEMTETILPTKLFEYMMAEKPIIAPNFGEFKRILINNYDSLLYNSTEELIRCIIRLQKDKELRVKLGTNANEKYFKSYRPEIYSKNYKI
jgi:glycosyltransferase involved in cell wall biosynthesis